MGAYCYGKESHFSLKKMLQCYYNSNAKKVNAMPNISCWILEFYSNEINDVTYYHNDVLNSPKYAQIQIYYGDSFN